MAPCFTSSRSARKLKIISTFFAFPTPAKSLKLVLSAEATRVERRSIICSSVIIFSTAAFGRNVLRGSATITARIDSTRMGTVTFGSGEKIGSKSRGRVLGKSIVRPNCSCRVRESPLKSLWSFNRRSKSSIFPRSSSVRSNAGKSDFDLMRRRVEATSMKLAVCATGSSSSDFT